MDLERLPVPIERLPDRASTLLDPRFGRGAILLAVFLVVVGFLLPFVESRELTASALEVAIDGASNLWLTPAAALAQLWILWRRPGRDALHAARGAVFALAVGGALPVLYTSWRITTVAAFESVNVDWLVGSFVIVAGLAIAAMGSLRLGAARRRRGL